MDSLSRHMMLLASIRAGKELYTVCCKLLVASV